MLKKIAELSPQVLGVRALGEVTKEDMESVLLTGLDELVAGAGKIRYLLVLETGVQNFTLAAWWKDMVAGLKHYTDWHRIAVVSELKAVEWFTDAFQLVVPGKSKGFSMDELEEAKEWMWKNNMDRQPSYLNFDVHSYAWKPHVDYRLHPGANLR